MNDDNVSDILVLPHIILNVLEERLGLSWYFSCGMRVDTPCELEITYGE